MAPLPCIDLGPAEQSQLLSVARSSIAAGLAKRRPLHVDPNKLEGPLAGRHGNFVTLTLQGKLRGCMGKFESAQPLTQCIASTAFNAAFNDPRFDPLARREFDLVQIEISVLSTPEFLGASSLKELLAQVRPSVDGLIIEDHGRRGTLLPKVWEQLPDANEFVTQVMLKAGLRPDHWSETTRCYRYESFCFAEAAMAQEAPA